ncbi:MAG: hypothetical protein FWC80_05770 [Firmicutes bacterium]|nr:hypothetical protein [Bacillota bacterium]
MFELHGETKNKPCACGCGEKAEVVIAVGEKGEIPITNDCMYKMVLELFSLCGKVRKNLIATELGSFKDRYGVLTHYGIADQKNDNSLCFFNAEKNKGIRIEWDDLYNFVRRTGIND